MVQIFNTQHDGKKISADIMKYFYALTHSKNGGRELSFTSARLSLHPYPACFS